MSGQEQQTAFFHHRVTIDDTVIDRNGHVNNVAYVRWMQDAAVAHTQACIHPDIITDMGFVWVARSHQIEYLIPTLAEDDIDVRTWIADFRRVRCRRRYEFIRQRDGKRLAQGETSWVLINAASGRPASIPDAILSAFEVIPD